MVWHLHKVAYIVLGVSLALFPCTSLTAKPSPALASSNTVLKTGGIARSPSGWTDFCRRYASDCTVDLSQSDTVPLNAQTWSVLRGVNSQVNRSVTAVSDLAHWGVVEQWNYPTDGKGDCEDYVLAKRRALEKAGIPRRALSAAVVVDENNEGHAVLLVKTDEGDFVLDNRQPQVLAWFQTSYFYVKRENKQGPGWVSLMGSQSPTSFANR